MSAPASPSLSMVSFSITSAQSEVSFVCRDSDTPTPAVEIAAVTPPSPMVIVSTSPMHIQRHVKYHYPNGDVKILVGHTLYHLHSDVLAQQSGWYRAYLDNAVHDANALPLGWRATLTPFGTIYVHHEQEKTHIERPSMLDEQTGAIVLEGVTVDEMDAFLAVLYPRDYVTFGLTSLYEWRAVIKVAYRWECSAIRALAIDRLDSVLGLELESFDRLILARQYDIESWVVPALDGLVVRSAPLVFQEIAQMLPEDVALVTVAREHIALLRTPPPSIPVSAHQPESVEQTTETGARPESFRTARPSSPDSDIETPALVAASHDMPANAQNTDHLQATQLGYSGDAEAPAEPLRALPGLVQDAPGENPDTQTRPRRDSGLRTLTLPARYSLG